jgi:hypothetical protein
MSAAAVLVLAEKVWPLAVRFWEGSTAAAAHASIHWASVAPDCRSATIMAMNVCLGMTPAPGTPGFAHLSLGWGWGLVGFLLGLLLSPHLLLLCRRLHGAAIPTVGTAPWQNAVITALAQTSEHHRRIVLQRLIDDGDEALQLLAASAGVSRRAALARVLGESVVTSHAAAWGV